MCSICFSHQSVTLNWVQIGRCCLFSSHMPFFLSTKIYDGLIRTWPKRPQCQIWPRCHCPIQMLWKYTIKCMKASWIFPNVKRNVLTQISQKQGQHTRGRVLAFQIKTMDVLQIWLDVHIVCVCGVCVPAQRGVRIIWRVDGWPGQRRFQVITVSQSLLDLISVRGPNTDVTVDFDTTWPSQESMQSGIWLKSHTH